MGKSGRAVESSERAVKTANSAAIVNTTKLHYLGNHFCVVIVVSSALVAPPLGL